MRRRCLAALVAALSLSAATAPAAEEAGSPPSVEAAPAAADAIPLPGAEAAPAAKETGPTFTFGAATSFVYDINEPDRQVTGENKKTYADGESEESFNIDLVQLGVSGTRGPASYGLKVDFGDWTSRVEDNLDGDVALQEAFLAVDAGFAVFTAGRIPTPLGYEVVEPWANPNISRSRGWWYQAISHDGVAVSGEVKGVNLMAAVVNGMRINQGGENNPDDEYGVIGAFGVPLGDADLHVAAIYSDEEDAMRLFELNGYVAGNWERWRYGLETTWVDGEGHGPPPVPQDVTVWDVTGYGGATFGKWSADLRLSYTDQEGTNGNYFNSNHEGIVSFTATGGYEIYNGIVLRAEYRVDSSDDPIFDDHNSGADLAGPFGQSDIVQVVNVQLFWAPSFSWN